jgi:hypothetical protein
MRNQFHDELNTFFIKNPTNPGDIGISIKRLTFKTTQSHKEVTIDLKQVFNRIHTMTNRPIIVFKYKLYTKYKVNTLYIGNLKKSTIQKITDIESKGNEHTHQPSLHVYFSFEKLDARLKLYVDGIYRVIYFLKSKDIVNLQDIVETYDAIGLFVKEMNEDGVYVLNKDTNIFESAYTDVLDFNTQSHVEIRTRRVDKSTFEANLNKIAHILQFINNKKLFKPCKN